MRIFSIASGSSGNCIFVGSGGSTEQDVGCGAATNVLVDAGVSTKRIVAGLEQNFIEPGQLDGILITHEHSDHIMGLPVFARKYHIPIYGTKETLAHIARTSGGKNIPGELFVPITPGETFCIGNMTIESHGTSHDAANPVMYTLGCEQKKVGIATDLGCYSEEIISGLQGADVLYLESNYDRNMLLVGIYPYYLKQRILGSCGHLSNDDSAELMLRLMHEHLKVVILAHLSKENNYPELAYQTMRNAIDSGWCYGTDKPRLLVANRDVPMECIEF